MIALCPSGSVLGEGFLTVGHLVTLDWVHILSLVHLGERYLGSSFESLSRLELWLEVEPIFLGLFVKFFLNFKISCNCKLTFLYSGLFPIDFEIG